MSSRKYQELYGNLNNCILKDEELNKYIEQYQKTKDKEALSKIIMSNLRLIISIVESYKLYNIDNQDLVEDGVLGLIAAVEHYDFSYNVPFPIYAHKYIKSEIIEGIKNNLYSISISKYHFLLSNNYKKLFKSYENRGLKLTIEDTMRELNLSREQAKKVADLYYVMATGTIKIGTVNHLEKGSSTDIVDSILYKTNSDNLSQGNHEKNMTDEECNNKLHSLLDDIDLLSEKEKEILVRHYGLYNTERETLQEIADSYNVSKSRVFQIEKKALNKLKIELKDFY